MAVESNSNGIKVIGLDSQEITSTKRIKELFKEGYHFKASTAISTLIDGYLYFIVNVNCEYHSITLKRNKDEKTGLLKITSGDALKIIKEYKFIDNKELINKLEIFIEDVMTERVGIRPKLKMTRATKVSTSVNPFANFLISKCLNI